MRLHFHVVLAAVSSVFLSSAAFAQEPTQPPAPVGGTAPAAAEAPPPAPKEDDGRLWIGFNVNGGVGTGAHLSGPAGGGTFRVGYALDHLKGVYGNITIIGWAAGSSEASTAGSNVSLGAIAGYEFTPMFALTPVDIFEVAAGPSLDYLTGGSETVTTVGGASGTVNGFSSLYFGLDGRLALHLGGRNPETLRRRGFTLSADVHPSFVSGGPVTFLTVGLGADWY
jgi:hypothetical protein